MIRRDYSTTEWIKKEDEYMKALEELVIPPNPTKDEVNELNSKVDSIYTQAGFEYAMIKRKYERVNLDLKNAEAELFNILKKQQLDAGFKVTEADVKSMIKTHLSNNNLPNYNADIYSVIKAVMDRHIFMEQVISCIKEKRNSVIAALGMLKLEKDFAGAKDL